MEDTISSVAINAIGTLYEASVCSIDCQSLISHKEVKTASQNDEEYQELIKTIQTGFPPSRSSTPPSIRKYWEVRNRLITTAGIVFLDHRLVIPASLQKATLDVLHSAHQGVTSMKARAATSIYWPGMDASIHNRRFVCADCNENAPSQPKQPICLTPSPEWPFQQVCTDYFESNGHDYLIITDRYSGWLEIYHVRPHQSTSKCIIITLRTLFVTYGVPEELSSDGGPQFKSELFGKFLAQWGVNHRNSSAEYPQSNGRAELGVKSAKRIIMNNTSADGSLNNDKAARAIMMYRNTPLPHINLSPAQILFHRQLRDHLPVHPAQYKLHEEWLLSAKQREEALVKRNADITTRYNQSAHDLSPLINGTRVLIQSNKQRRARWNKIGVIVECLPNRQYWVKVLGSGRTTLRNRRFLKPAPITCAAPSPVVSPCINTSTASMSTGPNHITTESVATNNTATSETHIHEVNPTHQNVSAHPLPSPPERTPETRVKIPRALKCLQTYNSPGLHEPPANSEGRREMNS